MTDIEILDRAMYTYLSTISPKVIYSTTNKAFQNMLKDSTYLDCIPLGMISYYRGSSLEIDDSRYSFTGAVHGDFTKLVSDAGQRRVTYVQSIPLNITYNIDIWSAKETSVQELAISLISKIYMQNQVLIAPMNPDSEDARFHITNVDWNDNSDLELENEKGRLYRHTITIVVESVIKLPRVEDTDVFSCTDVDIYNEGGSQ